MHLLIAAAGSGKRMGADYNKLLLKVAGRPILAWTFDAIKSAHSIDWIGVIGQPNDKESIILIAKQCGLKVYWINGGSTRQESVQLGLSALPSDAKYVLIHDGARCLVKPELFEKCAEIVQQGTSVVAATPVTDTIKTVSVENFILNTPRRSELWAAQTPQAFSVSKLREGHQKAIENDWSVTDDSSLFEKLGWPVKVLESPSSNIKVTRPFDLIIANALLSKRTED